ncbi:DUF4437 domain-containing protein [Aestuariibacter sp. A3R04]|uniref:DUF4437 domain-containing protein n=1 Tax=Aestuariibacter sp. A3R04 TaxID=2841571 RepID=UPI001C08B599|nr:DUF4437 domain-containing protein [Aestuariibacter sp. A3R04]MBU3021285.1 DUF4437 domain-containing protein [Aestuariibacter sp. A3R04]
MMKHKITTLAFVSLVLINAGVIASAQAETNIVTAEEVKWGYLNPARGDKSPGAADLWGDRTKDTATGMLVRFNKGFESPPHIHNVTYRGIVIEGEMHNDDPDAAKMWMPTGSFWTQPAGENHTTAANDKNNLIYLEIDKGPYLVQPSKEHFDNGERPINIHADNMVWLHDSDVASISANGVSATYLWGDTNAVYGSMIKLPEGFSGSIVSDADEFKAVVISGKLAYLDENASKPTLLQAASFIEASGDTTHNIRNVADGESIVFIRTSSPYQVKN